MGLGISLEETKTCLGASYGSTTLSINNSHTFRKGYLDTWSWKENTKGPYIVRSTYMKLMGNSKGESDKVFTELWSIRVILKAQIGYTWISY